MLIKLHQVTEAFLKTNCDDLSVLALQGVRLREKKQGFKLSKVIKNRICGNIEITTVET